MNRQIDGQSLTRTSIVVGGVVGVAIGAASYQFLLSNALMALTLAGLYTVGGSLLVHHVSVLDGYESNEGSWWVIAFGGTVGIVLLAVQEIYRPVILGSDLPGRIPAEEFVPMSMDASIALWLFVFGIALVSLNFGIGLALADVGD